MNKNIFIAVAMLCLSGCGVGVYGYYYISLEDVPNVEVISRAKIQLKGLVGNSQMVTGYALERELYSLRMSVVEKAYAPSLRISVRADGDENFYLKPRISKRYYSESGGGCVSYDSGEKDSSSMLYSWSSGCRAEKYPKTITFDVIGEDGNLVAKEDIPFKLIKNGTYILMDGL